MNTIVFFMVLAVLGLCLEVKATRPNKLGVTPSAAGHAEKTAEEV
jgi:hypothetical protein